MGDLYLNSHCRIICGDEIWIGDNVAITWDIELLDIDRHKLIYPDKKASRTAPVKIKDNVWIGPDV